MELELNRTHLSGYDAVLDATILHEETMEMIVPDACPDILRIVDTAGTVCLKSKEAQEGRAEVSGTVRCSVLYLPDGESGLRRIEANLPFHCTADAARLVPGCIIVASPRIQAAETRSLNPRKVLVRVNLALMLRGWAPAAKALATGAVCPQDGGVEQLKEQHNAYMVTCVQEKPFTFSDDLVISGSRPAAEEILKASVNLICNESKIIGSKLIFKGEADLRVCYRGAGGAICTVDYELPFSQIMEVIGVEEEADCALEVVLTDLNCALAGEDGRTISVALGLLAQATIREERSVELLADLYSTACVLTPERKSHTLRRLVERNLRRQTARETVETGMTAASTLDAAVTVCQVTQTGEGVHRTFSADTVLTVLYLSEENEPYSVCRQITVPCQVDLPEEAECFCGCKCVGEVFATPAGGGIEVRFDLEYQYLALASTEVSAVSGVQTGEAPPRTPGSQPSIVLRMVSGERLWDLAKAYNTTMATIMRANDLDREEPLGGKMLLIPKKRA